MGLLQRFLRDPTALETLQREVDELETRRGLIDRQRAVADRNLSEAIETRRTRLVEADADALGTGAAKGIVIRLRDEVSACDDALAVVGERLADARARLAAERDKQGRAAEGAHRTAQVENAKALLPKFVSMAEELASAMELLAPCAIEAGAVADNIRTLVNQHLVIAVEVGLAGASAYVERVVDGTEPIRTAPVALPPAPTPAKVARQSVVVLQASKWIENDEVVTTGRLTQAHVSVPLAERAVAIGNAIPVDSFEYRRLREIECGDFAWQDPKNCQWLDQTKPAPKPPEPHATTPLQHSLAGARTGIATAVPLR
jgi:hypothetical protein